MRGFASSSGLQRYTRNVLTRVAPEAAIKVCPTATTEFSGKLSWTILASFISFHVAITRRFSKRGSPARYTECHCSMCMYGRADNPNSPLRLDPTQASVCFIQFWSSRLGKSSRA